MKCPSCKEEIKEVSVMSSCFQTVGIEKDGSCNHDYSSPYVSDTISVHCVACDYQLEVDHDDNILEKSEEKGLG